MRRRKRKTCQSRGLLLEPLESRAMLHAAAVLSGSVYFDTDGDGARDASEVGIPGIVIELSNSADTSASRSAITNDNGVYTFDELEPGTYAVSKRQSPATVEVTRQDSTTVPGGVRGHNTISNLELLDDQILGSVNFSEEGFRPEHLSIAWFFASAPSTEDLMRETIARSEELTGNQALAASIRAGSDTPVDANDAPVALDDLFGVEQDQVLAVNAASGVLANDFDVDGDTLTATLVGQAVNGIASLGNDGSFTYTPNPGFNGTDLFTYEVSDGSTTSNVATATINVNRANQSPIASDDDYTVGENNVLTVDEDQGVLSNDSDPDNDALTAELIGQPAHGAVALDSDGGFTYTPDDDFSGDDSFTYRASDGVAASNIAVVRVAITPTNDGNELFGPVTEGSFEDPELLGARTDLVAGAPPLSSDHVDGDIDYTGYSNPPTYGPHHGFDPNGVDVNPGVTPRPTGVYTTEQPEEDLIHNLEHGHVWISYHPDFISAADLAALEQLVRDGSPNTNGSGVGVILTPRAANDTMIALASWAHLLTLDSYDPAAIRSFVETNRGHAPEGFITP